MTAARSAGLLLLLTAVATAASVAARLSADADQPTLAESLTAIATNRVPYSIGGAARLVSGLALLAAAIYLHRTLAFQQLRAAGLVGMLLGLSGAITAVSGVCALLLAGMAPDAGPTTAAVADARWITGKVGFTLAGLGLIALGPAQWRSGGRLKITAVAGVAIGVAMLFIWIDAATAMHRISGIAFLLWLIGGGVGLAAGFRKGLASAA